MKILSLAARPVHDNAHTNKGKNFADNIETVWGNFINSHPKIIDKTINTPPYAA